MNDQVIGMAQIGSYIFLISALVFLIITNKMKKTNTSEKVIKEFKVMAKLIFGLALLTVIVILIIKIALSGTKPLLYMP